MPKKEIDKLILKLYGKTKDLEKKCEKEKFGGLALPDSKTWS